MNCKNYFIIPLITMMLLALSCGKSIEKQLLGTWKVADVKTEFNENEVTPEMLRQVVDMQKQTYFRILDDSTMVIISSSNTYEANWIFDEETNEISYFFEGMETQPNKLGVYTDGMISNESKTALGTMHITYKKE